LVKRATNEHKVQKFLLDIWQIETRFLRIANINLVKAGGIKPDVRRPVIE